ncbi:hypothetical protein INR49_017504 [Caranx melampygus]|nr:hypothetical protein INR49_017504 [Caranx melampygus]
MHPADGVMVAWSSSSRLLASRAPHVLILAELVRSRNAEHLLGEYGRLFGPRPQKANLLAYRLSSRSSRRWNSRQNTLIREDGRQFRF